MCDGKTENCSTPGRRCPSSSPERRSAYRKAYAAARSARAGYDPVTAASGAGTGFDPTDLSDPEARLLLARQISAVVSYERTPEARALRGIVEDHLDARYGSREAAVRALGDAVALRAEEIAGVTGAEIQEGLISRFAPARGRLAEAQAELTARREDVRDNHGGLTGYFTDELQAERRALWDAEDRDSQAWHERWSAHEERVAAAREVFETTGPMGPVLELEREVESLRWARSSADDEARDQMRMLGDAYRQAIGEMREMGGDTSWHHRTKSDARRVFDAPVHNFPADWVRASTEAGPMVAKLSKRRAHYYGGHYEVTRKRVHARTNWTVTSDESVQRIRDSCSDNPYCQVADETVETSFGDTVLPVYDFEVASAYGYPADGPPPRGRGWEVWTSQVDGRQRWRRQKYRMEQVESERVAEIRSSPIGKDTDVDDRLRLAYGTAVHEWQHRFERTVPGITTLEYEFLHRRRGEDEELEAIYKGKDEMGYRDDFVEHYMGKVYDGNAYEVMSMGAESLFSGRNGGLVGAHSGGKMHADDDMRAFVLGVYASVGRSDVDTADLVASLDEHDRERYETMLSLISGRESSATPARA